jgi:hypothetical protein
VAVAARVIAARARRAARRLWSSHIELVESSVPYAAAATALLGGALGLIPPRDAIAAALSALLAAWASYRGRGRGSTSDVVV